MTDHRVEILKKVFARLKDFDRLKEGDLVTPFGDEKVLYIILKTNGVTAELAYLKMDGDHGVAVFPVCVLDKYEEKEESPP